MKEQLQLAWRINQSKNKLLISAISDNGMQASLAARGGRTVFMQWVHIHQVRLQWLEICARDIFASQNKFEKNTSFDRERLGLLLEESANGIDRLLERGAAADGKIKGFSGGVIPLLGYFISHESHHRGNILLTLKQNGEKIPDDIKWSLWEWGKNSGSS